MFFPLLLPNLAYWYDAFSITGLAGGSPVDQWNDLSGNARHMTSTLTARPVYMPSAFNNLPCLSTDGSNDFMIANGMGLLNFTIVMALFVRNRTLDNAGILSLTPVSGNDWNNVNGLVVYVSHNDNSIDVLRSIGTNTLVLGGAAGSASHVPQVLALRLSSGTAALKVNGIANATDTYSDLNAINFSRLVIGARGTNNIATTPFGFVDFAEIAIYSTALSDSDLSNFESYLMNKWRIM